MANVNAFPRKMSNTKLKLLDLNPHLMCVLCGGYYIDATTIVECLHSFCRSCIVKHLESSKYCPICEVQVHKTKPLINIRPDKTLQDIVYKLVPGLFANEMRNRRKFYRERPHYIKPNDSESSGEVSGERKIYVNDENITFSLVYHEGPGPGSGDDSYWEFPPPSRNERRYFKCPTGVTVQHLKKLLKAKHELNDSNYKLEVYFRDQELHDDFTLLDVAYVYLWKTKGTLDLTYKIFENVVKRQRIEEKPMVEVTKSVEIQETGAKVEDEKKTEAGEAEEKKKKSKKEEEVVVVVEEMKPEPEPVKVDVTKENGVTSEVKEVQLQISESGVMSVSQVEDSRIVRTVEETGAKLANNQITAAPTVKDVKPGGNKDVKQGTKEVRPVSKEAKQGNKEVKQGNGKVKQGNKEVKQGGNKEVKQGGNKEVKQGNGEVKPTPPPTEKKPSTKPLKPYKTIRYSPKTWHPVIPKEKLRPTLMKNSDEPRKPLKFFKMRNMPRFLGNPSSGVKPMFAEAEGTKPEEKKTDAGKTANKILKIDPKTLRPIGKEEMKMSSTPNAPNLLTNPFIPNNNHFLFSDLHLLPPNAGNFKEKPSPGTGGGGFKGPIPNGSYPPICFPTPEHSPPGFYPFKPQTFPFPPADKMDPLLRASRLSPFGNLAGFNVAGFHASLPPSISRLLNPHQHFRKIGQTLEKKNKDESTKRCDDSLKVGKGEEQETEGKESTGEGGKEEEQKKKKEEEEVKEGEEKETKTKEETEREETTEEEEKKNEVNGETHESASESKTESNDRAEEKKDEKEKEKEKDR